MTLATPVRPASGSGVVSAATHTAVEMLSQLSVDPDQGLRGAEPAPRAGRGRRGDGGVGTPGNRAGPHGGAPPAAGGLFAALAGMVVAYLALIGFAKRIFYRHPSTNPPARRHDPVRPFRRRAARFSSA